MGCCYLISFQDLATRFNQPVIIYDQLGIGRSTLLPEKKGHTDFWTVDLFLTELDNLLNHLGIQDSYDLYGNSWGGMLAAEHAIRRQPRGLNKLIIGNSPASMAMWGAVAGKLRGELPLDVQATLAKCEKDGTTDSKEYEDAVMVFNRKHLCRVDPWPPECLEMMDNLKKDDTVYHTMNGPSEFHVIGSLKSWSILDQIHKIRVPTLLINGRYDEATDELMEPFFKAIEKVKWVVFAESSHLPNIEERTRFMEVVHEFCS